MCLPTEKSLTVQTFALPIKSNDKSYPRGNFKWNQLDNGSISISLLTQFCESELKLSTNLDNNRSFPRNNKKLRLFTEIRVHVYKFYTRHLDNHTHRIFSWLHDGIGFKGKKTIWFSHHGRKFSKVCQSQFNYRSFYFLNTWKQTHSLSAYTPKQTYS